MADPTFAFDRSYRAVLRPDLSEQWRCGDQYNESRQIEADAKDFLRSAPRRLADQVRYFFTATSTLVVGSVTVMGCSVGLPSSLQVFKV